MLKRIPLWATLLPLLLGIIVYAFVWRSEAARLETDVRGVIGPAARLDMGGFPYRLAAETGPVAIDRRVGGALVQFAARRAQAHRQPFRHVLTVAAAEEMQLYAEVAGLAGARLAITAPAAQASLHVEQTRLQRLSLVFERATVQLPLLPRALSADSFELHLREVAAVPPAARNPKAPVRAEMRLEGVVRVADEGAPVTLTADLALTADAPLADVAAWRRGGTVELRSLTLADPTGFVFATVKATLAPLPDGTLAVAGTLDTSCPLTVQGMFDGVVPEQEFRTRRPLDFSLSGAARAPTLARTSRLTGVPARNREPPCPVLHR